MIENALEMDHDFAHACVSGNHVLHTPFHTR